MSIFDRKEESFTKENNEIRKERPGTILKKKSMMQKITTFVDDHLQEQLTLKRIAEYCGVSVSTVTQMFQHQTDMTFHSFVTMRRMEMARQLIEKGIPLEQVGKQVGYRDHSTFYRAFRQYFQKSPREYRNTLAENEA